MRKLIISCLMAGATLTTHAQQVYKEIYESSYQTLNDSKQDVSVRKIALFKVDALTYINTRILSDLTDSQTPPTYDAVAHRDSLAYYLYDYINLFKKEYARAQKAKDKERIMRIFRNASINNPLYNDPDRKFVLAYYNREDFLTQFSLDTNWIKANEEVRSRLKE